MRVPLRTTHIIAFVLAIILVPIPSGCGMTQREKTVHATFVALNASSDGFATWDATHQKAIVASATSLEDGKAKLAAYRGKRDHAMELFVRAYRTLAAAATRNDAKLVQELRVAAKMLKNELIMLMKE